MISNLEQVGFFKAIKTDIGAYVYIAEKTQANFLCVTVLLAKSDSDVVFCSQLFSKILTYTLHLSLCESIDHLCINPIMCINPILWIGLIK